MTAIDRPTVVTTLAARLLADQDVTWGRAMLGELASLDGRAARWRFATGCLRAALFAPVRRPGVAVTVSLLALADVGAVALALARYPGLRSGVGVWLAVTAFLVVITVYALVTVALARRTSGEAFGPLATPVAGGLVVAAIWTGLGDASSSGTAHVSAPLMLVAFPLTCLAVGATGVLRRGSATGTQGVVMAGVLAGLVIFLSWTAEPIARGGRPYHAGLVRDFHSSGGHDLATYAINDSLGTAMVLLLLVPLLTVAVGLTGQAAAVVFRRRLSRGTPRRR